MNTRLEFLRTTGLAAGTLLFLSKNIFAAEAESAADYTVRIKVLCESVGDKSQSQAQATGE